eukprot:scaffold2651_cov118-Isochrysis_galbana.AAC.1
MTEPKKKAPSSTNVNGTASARIDSVMARTNTVVSGFRRTILRMRTTRKIRKNSPSTSSVPPRSTAP